MIKYNSYGTNGKVKPFSKNAIDTHGERDLKPLPLLRVCLFFSLIMSVLCAYFLFVITMDRRIQKYIIFLIKR